MITKSRAGVRHVIPMYAMNCSRNYVLDEPEPCNCSTWLYSTYYDTWFDDGNETIVYENNTDRFNYCHHEKSKLDPIYEVPRTFGWHCQGTPEANFDFHGGYGCSIRPWMPALPDELQFTEALSREAWASLQPSLNDGFSFANFLFELKDFRMLWKQTKALHHLFKNLSWKEYSAGRTLAEIHLMNTFGVEPLARDIATMYNTFFDTNKRVNEFIERGKKVNSYHWRKEQILYESGKTQTFAGYYKEVHSVTYAATLKASYQYDDISGWEGFTRYHGLRLTPEVVWNAIPFSFVVDWVVRIGQFLRQFDQDPHLTLKIHDYCESVKSENRITEYASEYGTAYEALLFPGVKEVCCHSNGSDYPLWSTVSSIYHREPCEPNVGYAFPVTDALSARELVLAGALMRTNIRL